MSRVIPVLENEITAYRKAGTKNEPGYLLEFADNIPVLLVPDLHARNGFFISILNLEIEGIPVLERIKNRSIRVICLGDGMHAESRSKQRWISAYESYCDGDVINTFLYEEMAESLQLMMKIMRCKTEQCANFHFLKGNHENILNEEGGGNHPFYKFAMEGQMVRDFMISYYGMEITKLYYRFEKLLPLFVIGQGFLASHAEPASVYTKKQLINAGYDASICEGLTWTANNTVSGEAVKTMLKKYQKNYPEARYFAGHRPVRSLVEYRADGKFVQIHNPSMSNVVYLKPGETFNPDTCIIQIGAKNE